MKYVLALAAVGCTLSLVLAVPTRERFHYVDLQPKANQKFTDNFGSGVEGNNLAALPAGEQAFGGINFKVGPGMIQLGSRVLQRMPDKVEGIAVNGKFRRLHILHATGYGGSPNRPGGAGFVADGTSIGEYRLRYEDLRTETIPIVYGKDVRDWYFVEGDPGVTRGKIVWVGDNARTKQLMGVRLRLYLTTWENPRPGKRVTHIDYVSRKGETAAAPFCLAITLEER